MRVGANPAKESTRLDGYGMHRIIVPVYVPTSEGYFARVPDILKLCLESLHLTTSGKAAVTVISNGSSAEVEEELLRMFRLGWFDQLLLNEKNRGKVDAVVSAARGFFEELITISDSDVLFKAGWLGAVEQIFENFPECGYATPFFSPNGIWNNTSATLLGALFRRELSFAKVVNEDDLDRFAHSIGRPDLYTEEHRRQQLIVRRNGALAGVGGGHFCLTMHRELLSDLPNTPSLLAMGGTSERDWFDIPPDKLGYWRLSTAGGYVYHMGNIPDTWMYEELETCRRDSSLPISRPDSLPRRQRDWVSKLPYPLRITIARAIRKYRLHKPMIKVVTV
jgi:hypothetical protein